jgi:hypothetical protein
MAMLPLDDERWKSLTTFFGEPENLPVVIKKWLEAIGTDLEFTIYSQDLFDVFPHQVTITNAAFAVVPYLVHICKEGRTRYQIEYLTDVALVEANRLKSGVHYNREDTQAYPEWLMLDYQPAIAESRSLIFGVLGAEPDQNRKRGLLAMQPALFGDADLAWSQW